MIFQFYSPPQYSVCFPDLISRVNVYAGNLIFGITAFVFRSLLIICGLLTKRKVFIVVPLTLLFSLPIVFYGYSLGLIIGYWVVGKFTGFWIPSPMGALIQILFIAPFLVVGLGRANNNAVGFSETKIDLWTG